MRIITVTLNPALDKTAGVDDLQPGELNRLRGVMVDAGGKGINVSKMIAALGGASVATGFLGGGAGAEIMRALDSLGIAHDFVSIAAPTRTNLKVVDRGSRLTELNEPGPPVSPAEYAALSAKLEALAGPDALFVFSGSIPDGLPPDVYAGFIRMAKKAGAKAFLDADGAAFSAAIDSGADFIKPNCFEILQYHEIGRDAGIDVILQLCRGLLSRGIGRMAVSMGADGALFVSPDEAFLCPGIDVAAHSAVGAGDSMVGAVAYAAAAGMSWRETAALAMASGAGAVTTAGTKAPSRGVVDGLVKQVRFVPVQ